MYVLKINHQDLDLDKILQSGQVFRYEIISDNAYVLIYQQHYVVVRKLKEGYQFNCDAQTFEQVWYPYLGLDIDYDTIKQAIIDSDARFKEVINMQSGLRILRQDAFEMLITFIISQSKSIPQIRKLVNELARTYGSLLGEVDAKPIYSFPRSKDLKEVTEEQFRQMKFGYRAPYLVDAIDQVNEGSVQLVNTQSLTKEMLMTMLKQIKGVGDKVAACVMLFGLGDMESFPVDVWMRKTMMHLYSEIDPKAKDIEIQSFGKMKFGKYAGIAQQYIFEYGRQTIKKL